MTTDLLFGIHMHVCEGVQLSIMDGTAVLQVFNTALQLTTHIPVQELVTLLC